MTKTIGEFEREKGWVIEDVDTNQKITEAEFTKLTVGLLKKREGIVGVNHEDRIKFLTDNGYEVTRKNLIDSDLSAKQPDEA